MKKHIVLIMNIVLVAVIVGAIGFTVVRVLSAKPTPAVSATEAVTEVTEAPTVDESKHFKVGIVRNSTSAQSENCYAGFISQLKDRELLDNIDVVYIVEEDEEKCASEIQRVVDDGCDLLYTIGSFASESAAMITDEIPIVFAAVEDPEEAGLVQSNGAPGGNITGVSSYTPCFEQIDLIPVLIKDADSVAAVYTATDEDSVLQAIIACKEAEDFEYTAKRYPVTNATGIVNALNDIAENGYDAIYLPIDELIIKNLPAIVEFSLENKIPVICGSEKMLKKGCLATCEINYTSIGRKSADLSYDILYGEKDPASLPVIYKYDCYNYVNKQTLDKLGLKLSDIALANVEIKDYTKEL